jgi:hypothetical protein
VRGQVNRRRLAIARIADPRESVGAQEAAMDEQEILARVRAAGLEATFARFGADVRAALDLAVSQGAALAGELPPELEPWPPMRPGPLPGEAA